MSWFSERLLQISGGSNPLKNYKEIASKYFENQKLSETPPRVRQIAIVWNHPNPLIQQGPPRNTCPIFFGGWVFAIPELADDRWSDSSVLGWWFVALQTRGRKDLPKGLKQVGEFVPKGDIWHFRMVMHWHLIISKWNDMQMYDEHRQN